jgi:hypothetical protein
MQKGFLLFLICLVLSTRLCAQTITESAPRPSDSSGLKNQLGYLRLGLSFLVPFNQQSNPVIFPAITVAPGIRIMQTKDFILSLSVPLSVMGTFKYDYLLGIDLPFMLDFNLGAAAGNDQKSTVGFILGAGYAYIDAVNNYNGEEGVYKRADFWGCRFQFGMDIGKEDSQNDRDIIMLSFGRGFTNSRLWMIGLSFQVLTSRF